MKALPYILLLILTAACSGSEKSADTDSDVTLATVDKVTEVDTISLRIGPFTGDIVSNGNIRAGKWADLHFRNQDIISEVYVREGDHVRAGQPIAQLDLFKYESDKARQEASLEQARLELQDVLISQGYDPAQSSAIPADVMRLARVKSGLARAEADYNATLRDIEQATLVAPFDGVVANLAAQAHSMPPSSDPVCRIISTGEMKVQFPVLESEINLVNPGDIITVTPFAGGESVQGRITEINPQIDASGHIRITASVPAGKGLMDGMNVRVRSRRDLGGRLSVPKSALVLRTGRQVIFTYEDGKAIWNYVTTGLENSDSYEILDGLTEGMTVIVGGNENLAHESPVKIRR